MPSGRRGRDGRAQSSPPPQLTSPPPPPPPSRPHLTSPAFHDIADLPSSSAPALNDTADLPSSSAPAMHDTALLPTAHLQATSAAASTAEQIRPVADVLRESERRAAVALHKALPPPPHASPPTGFKVPDLLSLKLDINLLADSCISTLVPTGLMIKYFVRVDNDGIFHTYPDRGGPFESIQEVQEAIDSHHAVQRKNICMDGLTDEERAIRYALYWYHDGTRKHSKEALVSCSTDLSTKKLVKAVLDKYNEDNGLVGDLAYELEDIVSYNSCFDGKDGIYRSYDHFNLTMKTKGAANNDLYFAEVTCMDDHEVYVLTCICMVKPDDNGECHVCGADIKHPAHDGYNRGRPQMSYGHHRRRARGVPSFEKLFAVRDEAWLKEEEDRVRRVIMEGKEDRRRSEVEQGKRGNYVIPARRRLTMS